MNLDDVGCVIVTYRTPSLAARLAEALAPAVEVVVVDHGGGVDPIDRERVRVVVRINDGFGAGVNAGAALLTNPYLLILNPDVVIGLETIGALRDALAAEPTLAVVAPRLVDGDGVDRRNGRPFPTVANTLVPRRLRIKLGREAEQRVDWLAGAALLLRRSDFDAVAGFDARRYFLYWEDADLCWRLHDRGRGVRRASDQTALHAEHASGTSRRTIYHFHRSAYLLHRRIDGRAWTVAPVVMALAARCAVAITATSLARAVRSRQRMP